MLILVPILIIIAIVVAIDQIYFKDAVVSNPPKIEHSRKIQENNATKEYLERYIKKEK